MLNILSAGGLWSIMLLLRRCCVTIRDLSIKENDVMAMGFKGKQIGQVLQSWKVDCILSHCGPSSVVRRIDPSYGSDQLTDFLETVDQLCQFTYWFFGHYHDNRIIDDKYILQWEQISALEV